MRFSRRSLGAALAGLTLVLSAGACSSGGAGGGSDGGDTIEVNFGYIPDFNGTSLLAIAEDQGLWEEHGIDATTSSFTNGPLQIQALGTGDLDFGYIGPGAFWLPASGQAQIVALNTLGRADRVVAQPGIESIEDLRGRTVAVPEGTSGDMILTLALEEAGMTKDDVELVPMEPPAIVAALSSGQVDAAGFWYPALATVQEQVPDLVELAGTTSSPRSPRRWTPCSGCCARPWPTGRRTWTRRSSSPPTSTTSRWPTSRRTPPTWRCSRSRSSTSSRRTAPSTRG
jgi:NitT/TauT family transport system substrate-binding protein